MPSSTLDSGMYFVVASSARSPTLSSTGVVCVWNPVIVLGRPACAQAPAARAGFVHLDCQKCASRQATLPSWNTPQMAVHTRQEQQAHNAPSSACMQPLPLF